MGSETTNASRRDRPTPTAVVPVYGSFRLCGLLVQGLVEVDGGTYEGQVS